MAANVTLIAPVQPVMALISIVLNPPLPGFLLYVPFLCRLSAIILATPFAIFTVLDVIAYAIARTLHISLRSLRVPHSPPPTKPNSLAPNPSVVPLTPSASALSLIQDSGSETEGDEAPRPSAERRRSEKGLRMTDLAGSAGRSEGLRMRKVTRPDPRPEQGLALEFSPSPAPSTISNVSALSQFSVDSSTPSSVTTTPTIELSTSKEPPMLGPPVSLETSKQTQTAYPSPPLSPAPRHAELLPVEVPSPSTAIPTDSR